MRQHYLSLSDTKQQYRQIFQRQRNALEAQLVGLRSNFSCESCTLGAETNLEPGLDSLHANCGFRAWQQAALAQIETDGAGQIIGRLNAITAYKNTFNCHQCGMCCRMASSESSYDELTAKAQAGDDFARQFTSVFLPYASREAARQMAPDVVSAVLAEASEAAEGQENIFFYHCPYLGEDNRCTVYGTDKRPNICASYPETPLDFIYKDCAWKPWKEETHPEALALHAMLALCENLSQRLRLALA
jgi:Fe-S-cluster containining protein